jgi:hypothetical protein
MKDLLHVAAGDVGGLFPRAPVLVVVLGCLVQTVASNARLVPYVKESLAVSTGLVRAAVVTVTSTVPVPAEGRRR